MHIWFNKSFSSVYTAIELLKQSDVEGNWIITYSNSNPHAVAGNVADRFVLEPAGLLGEDYLAWCLQVCRTQRVDIFWPGKQAQLIASHTAQFAALGTRVVSVASPEVLRLLDDKAAFCADVDLPMAAPPQSRLFASLEQFRLAYQELRGQFPRLCVKPSKSVYGLGFSLLDEEQSSTQILIQGEQYKIGLSDFERGLETISECKPMLLMEYLEGPEYSVDCVANQGQLICAIPRKKSQIAGYGQKIDRHPVILESVKKLAQQYQLNGIFNVQFKETQGQVRLLEINARMSGGIGMACLAGPNLPSLVINGMLHGFDQIEVPEIAYGMRVTDVATPIIINAPMVAHD
ncbi:MAG: ATP-grasp domain-containing protein [Undibacterium sp.]|nr:ATP-grasp domain-containing protein [Undibacterium sp.]